MSKQSTSLRLAASSFTAPICTTSVSSPGRVQRDSIEPSQAVNSRSKTTAWTRFPPLTERSACC